MASTPYQTTDTLSTVIAPAPILGVNTADTVGFYGNQGTAQPSGPYQAALATTAPMGNITTYAISEGSLSSVAANTTSEQSVTVTGVVATDMVFVNKLTQQAGLLCLGARVSAANTVKVVYGNNTGSPVTPASEVEQFTTVPASLQLSCTISPAAVAATSVSEQTFTCTGVYPGMVIQVNKPTTQVGLGIAQARVVANNQIAIQFVNLTASPITPTAAEVY